MAKRLIHDYNFTRDSSDGTKGNIVINEIVPQNRFLLITDVKSGAMIQNFADPVKGITSVSHDNVNNQTTIVLEHNTSSMDSADPLQIFVEDVEGQEVHFAQTYVDPVSKFRVSQPENLIDTDFEYGLQSTKWETLELVKNIPTFFSRNGDTELTVVSIVGTAGSDLITVTTTEPHGMARGNPILVIGSSTYLADGGFVVTSVQSDYIFNFTAKGELTTSGSIKDTYTQIFVGNVYQGTEFDLAGIGGITTDEATPNSTLTVTTKYPTNFNEGTSFFMSNSFARASLTFTGDSSAVSTNTIIPYGVTRNNATATNETPVLGYSAIGGTDHQSLVQPSGNLWFDNTYWSWHTSYQNYGVANKGQTHPYFGLYFDPDDLTVDTGANTITFPSAHNLRDGQTVIYFKGDGNTVIGGLTDKEPYNVRVVDGTTIYLTSQYNTSTVKVSLTSSGVSGKVAKAGLLGTIPLRYTYGQYGSGTDWRRGFFWTRSDYSARRGGMSYYPYTYAASSGLDPIRGGVGGIAAGQGMGAYQYGLYTYDGVAQQAAHFNWRGGDDPDPSQFWPSNNYNNTGGTGNRTWHFHSSSFQSNYWEQGPFSLRQSSPSSSEEHWSGSYTWSSLGFAEWNDNSTSTNAYARQYIHLVPFALNNTRNSLYFPGHSFVAGSGTLTMNNKAWRPTVNQGAGNALDSNESFQIEIVNADRIRLIDSSGTEVNFTSSGDSQWDYTINQDIYNANANTILFEGNSLTNGDMVTYSNNGASNVPGLVDGTNYYVFNRTTNRIGLASNQDLWTGVEVTVPASAVKPSLNAIDTGRTDWTTGRLVEVTSSATMPGGLTQGGLYHVKDNQGSTDWIQLYRSAADAAAASNPIGISTTGSGNITIKESYQVDLTGIDSGSHGMIANFIGAADGVYSLDSNTDPTNLLKFTLRAPNQVLRRTLTNKTVKMVDLTRNAIRYKNHGLIDGNSVLYTATAGYPIGGLSNNGTYYVKRLSNHWFRLATTEADALDSASVYISLDSASGGASRAGESTFQSNSVAGETLGVGLIDVDSDSKIVTGTDTNFTSNFNSGDEFNIYTPERWKEQAITGANTSTDVYTSPTHNMSGGDLIMMGGDSGDAPNTFDSDEIFYINAATADTFSIHKNPADGISGSNKIGISTHATGDTYRKLLDIGQTVSRRVTYVNSKTKITLDSAPDIDNDSAGYSVNSALLVRADGFALHRPYDGGVELIPPKNPDSRMIRQTRKYFRYQSGKGIQVSYAVNFKPSVDIDTFNRDSCVGTITTRGPNRMTTGLTIQVDGATNGAEGWDSDHYVSKIIDPYTFNVHMGGGISAADSAYDSASLPASTAATGIPVYHVKNWTNSSLRCGLFDDQNGLYFDFDGTDLGCVVRSSTQQLSGTASVEFKSGKIIGTGSKYASQISVGESIVLKGVSYTVTKISSDTVMYILPSYRGVTMTGVIITKTEDRRTAQNQWNIDKADGTGKYGFNLDLSHIQMAYIDYSWYGAGKVRFGFKDQNGNVKYVHEEVHGNKRTEAYMRSGNVPARYEIMNIGTPSYVPALAHWGTSVIMDGRFDNDKAYIFTANSLTNTISAGSTLTANGRYTTTNKWQIYNYGARQWNDAGWALLLSGADGELNAVAEGMGITGTGTASGTKLMNPTNTNLTPYQPYHPGVLARPSGSGSSSWQFGANLLIQDKEPSTTTVADSDHTITIAEGGAISPTKDLPIISIRLAPSVDTNTPGLLGEREIINRMQLVLNEVDVLTTHGIEVELRLNGLIDNNDWSRVDNPSLSQLVFHGSSDNISGGTVLFSFNANGGTGTSNRTALLTSKNLGDVATLGNSILGGDAIFPDGPDVLTVVAKLREDPSTVTASQPYSVSGRISWSESQA